MDTLYDLVSRVLDSQDGYDDPINLRRAVRASIWGADQVTQRHAWTDYHTVSTHSLNAPVTATVSIDTHGNLTIDSGTLPEWVTEASVKIGNHLYTVVTRKSNTVATLENYGGLVLPGQSVTFVHNRLLIRDNVRHIYSIHNLRDDIELIFVTPGVFHTHQLRQNAIPSDPTVVTSTRSATHPHRTELVLSPAPSTAMVMRVTYYRVARKATVMHDCGSASINADALDEVTITKAIRTDNPYDLVLVLAGNDKRPDAELGFAVADANPAVATLDVADIESPTKLILKADYAQITNKAAILTQRLDLPSHTHEAAAMYAEAKYLQIGKGSIGDFWQTIQMADAELRTAMELESTLSRTQQAVSRTAVYTRPEKLVGVDP